MLNVHLRITDATTHRPVPVRVRITGPDGTPYAPLGRPAEFACGRNEDVGGHLKLGRERWFYIDGACEVPLPAGVPLRVQAAKGPEWTPLDAATTLGAGQISLRFAIERWVDTRAEGWVTFDARSHFLSPHAALLEAQAEDLMTANVLATPLPVLALDANTYTTTPNLLAFSGQAPALERNGHAVVVNTFNTHPVLGKVSLLNSHRPVFPLTFGGEDSDDWGICDWCDQCHRKRGLVVWVDAFEPAGGITGGEALVAAILGKIDAIEVCAKPRKSSLMPWVYRLWDAGVMVPLVGASGKDSNTVPLGAMRTYAGATRQNPSPTPPLNGEGLKTEGSRESVVFGSAPPSFLGKGVGGLGLAFNSSPTPPGLLSGPVSRASRGPEHGEELKPNDSSAPPSFTADPREAPLTGPERTEAKGVGGLGSSWLDAVRAGRTFVTTGPLLTLTVEGSHVSATSRSPLGAQRVEIVVNGEVVASGEHAEATVSEPGWVAARAAGGTGFAHTSPVVVGEPTRKPDAVAALKGLIEQTQEWIETQGRFVYPKRKQALLDRCIEASQKLGE
ncbi:Hypothetical conserved protein OS=uncultured planctomycete GN=HGMM_F09D09C15 PE=4 SV=1 [Gemmata massiliana]|uniref:Hypothetical conserved protein n=1 Tax=Gemmata massiliana TaxID=1210884 RepID=A0A6P2CSN8_9BACT|nr:hypothetical protein [Gemmata massiliana]VTR91949.1 Hypothetical conserved protein OS=uncultured planctomycete GN=HGMM_F09D09C15 PE=4 SV=1 [Gemmata massiliana]